MMCCMRPLRPLAGDIGRLTLFSQGVLSSCGFNKKASVFDREIVFQTKAALTFRAAFLTLMPVVLPIQHVADFGDVGADAKDIETHRGKVCRHDPAVFAAVGNNGGLDFKRRLELTVQPVPE